MTIACGSSAMGGAKLTELLRREEGSHGPTNRWQEARVGISAGSERRPTVRTL